MKVSSLRGLHGRVALVALLAAAQACASERDTNEASDTSDTRIGTSEQALTTPNGSNWIVLPRPPARVTRAFGDAYVAPFAASGTGYTATPTTATKYEGTTGLAVNLAGPSSRFALRTTSTAPLAGAGQTELAFAFSDRGEQDPSAA